MSNLFGKYRYKVNNFLAEFESNLSKNEIMNFKIGVSKLSKQLSKSRSTQKPKILLPPYTWFKKSVSKMTTSEINSLKQSIGKSEAKLVLPHADALRFSDNFKGKVVEKDVIN